MAEQENEKNQEQTNEQLKETNKKEKKFKTRTILVVIAIVIFLLVLGINCRTNYLELLEIGENYTEVFSQNLRYRLAIGAVNFVFVFIAVCITNSLIKKGLRSFFEQEKKEFPKLPNKSLALIFALIAAMVTPNLFLEKLILFKNTAQFGISDPIFGLDIGFYMFQEPFIGLILYYLTVVTIILTIYTAIYYIITFNVYFDGIDGQTLKGNTFIKHLLFNVMIITILIVGIMMLNTQNIVLDNFLTLNDELDTEIVGAGTIDTTVKLWGYRILGVVIILSVAMAIKFFKKSSAKNVIKSLLVVPVYLVILFVVMVGYKMFFMNGSELDKEKSYITTNIDYTKTAYNIKIDEIELESTGTITKEEANKNAEVINNTPIITEEAVLNILEQTQASTGYYTYNNVKPTLYKDKLTYIAAREINSANTTYNSKSDEYTHGYGAILVSANETDENGNVVYISKEFESKNIKEPRIYYGTGTNNIISISEKKPEFDYPKTTTENATNNYQGTRRNQLKYIRPNCNCNKREKTRNSLFGK